MRMQIRTEKIRHIVVGSGAAGYRAAVELRRSGLSDMALVTEDRLSGTSRNTGSDKQTYYKLSLAGETPDSVLRMAADLAAGGSVDGDNALVEAALSARAFYFLTESGVPFPCTQYGEYMGYQTDHDTGSRATSAGPYTSKIMTECLERTAMEAGVRILDHMLVIRVFVRQNKVAGILALDLTQKTEPVYLLIRCTDVVLATGGPAGLYLDSVYPVAQHGMSSLAYECGAAGQNLTEWQYGMASLRPRWNVSGSYMQCIPRFFSTKEDGSDTREFLSEYYKDPAELLTMTFLKGYQWPFDVKKIRGGSSVIDLLVYRERIMRGRRVYLDFTCNPCCVPVPFERISEEARIYLSRAHAMQQTPVERLRKLNEPAVSFYLDHGVDLDREPLEIAVCAQHNNGGVAVDANWESSVNGLYVVGEAAGTHGVTRPGGTALNAGQAGAMRAAHHIVLKDRKGGRSFCERQEMEEALMKDLYDEARFFALIPETLHGKRSVTQLHREQREEMSAIGGMIRNPDKIEAALDQVAETLHHLRDIAMVPETAKLPWFYRLRDQLLVKQIYLTAMLDYAQNGAGSRGSALYTDLSGEKPEGEMPDLFRCRISSEATPNLIQEIRWDSCSCNITWRKPRQLPDCDYFFENEWTAWRKRELRD